MELITQIESGKQLINRGKTLGKDVSLLETKIRDLEIQLESEKGHMLDKMLAEIDTVYAPSLYLWIDENAEELSTRITEAEEKVNELYKSGLVEEFKSALGEYKKLHGEAFNKMIKLQSGGIYVHDDT